MNVPRNHWILLSSLASVFLITFIFARGPGYGGNFYALLGIAADRNATTEGISPEMSQGDMVTPMVTKKSMVTKQNVTNVTSMSPQITTSIAQSPNVQPSLSPSPSLPTPTVSPSPNPTPPPSPSVSPSPTLTPSLTPTFAPTPAASGNVIISEIAWMGTSDSASDEWIELFNTGMTPISLEGWRIASVVDNNPSIPLEGIIPAGGYYLIERTDDGTISDIPAQLVKPFGSGLNNGGESLALIDAEGTVRDAVNASGGWFAGNNADKTSMERVSPEADGSLSGSWISNDGTVRTGHDNGGNPINGTPGSPNSSGGF